MEENGKDKVESFRMNNFDILSDHTKTQFIALFREYMDEVGLTEEDMTEWAIDFDTFLCDNRTFALDPETLILKNLFFPEDEPSDPNDVIDLVNDVLEKQGEDWRISSFD